MGTPQARELAAQRARELIAHDGQAFFMGGEMMKLSPNTGRHGVGVIVPSSSVPILPSKRSKVSLNVKPVTHSTSKVEFTTQMAPMPKPLHVEHVQEQRHTMLGRAQHDPLLTRAIPAGAMVPSGVSLDEKRSRRARAGYLGGALASIGDETHPERIVPHGQHVQAAAQGTRGPGAAPLLQETHENGIMDGVAASMKNQLGPLLGPATTSNAMQLDHTHNHHALPKPSIPPTTHAAPKHRAASLFATPLNGNEDELGMRDANSLIVSLGKGRVAKQTLSARGLSDDTFVDGISLSTSLAFRVGAPPLIQRMPFSDEVTGHEVNTEVMPATTASSAARIANKTRANRPHISLVEPTSHETMGEQPPLSTRTYAVHGAPRLSRHASVTALGAGYDVPRQTQMPARIGSNTAMPQSPMFHELDETSMDVESTQRLADQVGTPRVSGKTKAPAFRQSGVAAPISNYDFV